MQTVSLPSVRHTLVCATRALPRRALRAMSVRAQACQAADAAATATATGGSKRRSLLGLSAAVLAALSMPGM